MDLLLNCDLGEAAGGDQLATEAQVMPYIDQANIACGFHAGNPQIMDQTLVLAKQHQVAVGAHPSYPDKFNFGRQSMTMTSPDLIACLNYQIASLEKNAKRHAINLDYVKPHGALYSSAKSGSYLAFRELSKSRFIIIEIIEDNSSVLASCYQKKKQEQENDQEQKQHF